MPTAAWHRDAVLERTLQRCRRLRSQSTESAAAGFVPTYRITSDESGQGAIHLSDCPNDFWGRLTPRRPGDAELRRVAAYVLRLIHDESWETHNVPGPIAKTGAWMQDHIPGQDSFIKPWMIDRANDHYALNITRVRTLLDWEPRHRYTKPCRRW